MHWIGYLDEPQEITASEATFVAYPDVAGMRSQLPRRPVAVTCPHELGSELTNVNWSSVTRFDGADCGYRRIQGTNTTAIVGSSSMIGFYGALIGDVGPTANSIQVVISTAFRDAGMRFIVSDEVRIGAGTEYLGVTSVAVSLDGLTWTLGVSRAVRGGDPASYTAGATTFFANCQKTTSACKCRGNYGNNPNDTYIDPGGAWEAAHGGPPAIDRSRNYFGAVPIITGYQAGKFQTQADQKAAFNRVFFAGNQSAYDKPLPLVYGRSRLANPILICAFAQGAFLTTLWALCEGTLATNPNDNQQSEFRYLDGGGNGTETNTGVLNPHYQYNAFLPDPAPPASWAATDTNPYPERYFRVNGSLRHDHKAGFGSQVGIGNQEQLEPSSVFLPNIPDFQTNRLGFWGMTWVILRIDTTNNPSIDASGASINGAFGIQYGRLVRVYSNTTSFAEKATTNDAWVMLDVLASRRAGAGVPYTQIHIQSFLDHAAYCDTLVRDVAKNDGTMAKRFTFNGALDTAKADGEWMSQLAMGSSATRPFLDAQGLYKIKTLRAVTADELAAAPLFSDKDAESRNILWENGETTVKKFCRRRKDAVPNQIRATFVNAAQTTSYQADAFIGGDGFTIALISGSGTGLFIPGVDRVAINGTGSYLVTAETHVGNVTTSLTVSPAILGNTGLPYTNIHRASVANLSDFQKIEIVINDEASQALLSGGIRNIVPKSIDLVGCTTLDQAVRRATLVARIGEFGEGGLANNDGLRWSIFVKGGSDCEIGDVVPLESNKLDPILERYWRITDINETPFTLPDGTIVFRRDFEAMVHDNSFFDDTGFTISEIIPLNPGSALNAEPPAVATFGVTDQGTIDENGTLMTNLTFTYTLPDQSPELIRSIVIMRSHDDGSGNPAGGWRLVTELSSSPTTIKYPVSGQVEWFCALSRPLTGHLPNIDTKLADDSYQYPRVSCLVDGMADTALSTPTGLQAFGEESKIHLIWNAYTGTDSKLLKSFNVYRNTVNDSSTATLIGSAGNATKYDDFDPTLVPTTLYYYWIRGVSKLQNTTINGVAQSGLSPFSAVASDNPGSDATVPNAPVINVLRDVTNLDGNFTFIIGVDAPRVGDPNGSGETAPTNWDTVEQIQIQIAIDSGFTSIVWDQTYGFTRPPFTVDYEVQAADIGTFYFRARVINIFGNGAWSATFTRSTNYAIDTDIMGVPTNVTVATKGAGNDLNGNEVEIDFTLPGPQTDGFWGKEYMIHNSPTLPDPDVDATNSAYAVTGAAGTGSITVGSNVLTDNSKTFTTAGPGLTGRRVMVFSEKRPTSGTWSMAGNIHVATIQSNDAHHLVLDRKMRLSGTNIQYAVLSAGGQTTEEKVKGSNIFLDSTQSAVITNASSQHSLRIPTGLQGNAYLWLSLWNLWGAGALYSYPLAVTVHGIAIADIVGDGLTPSAPTGVGVAGAFRSLIINWTNAANTDLVSTEIWRAAVNNVASATKVATVPFPQQVWADEAVPSGTTYYYWIRHVDKDGNTSPYHAANTSGSSGTTVTATLTGTEIAALTITAANIVAFSITADRVTTTSLDAFSANLGNITSGTITAATFQTAASGARVSIDASNGLQMIDGSANVILQLPLTGSVARIFQIAPISTSSAGGTYLFNGDLSAYMTMRDKLHVSLASSDLLEFGSSVGLSSSLYVNAPEYKIAGTTVIDTSGGVHLRPFGSKAAFKAGVTAYEAAFYADGGVLYVGTYDGGSFWSAAMSIVP